MGRTIWSMVVVLALVAAACGSEDTVTEADPGAGDDEVDLVGPTFDEPPPIEVTGSDGPVALRPFTYCWTAPVPDGADESVGICADGVWPDPVPPIGAVASPVTFRFPVDGWTFNASTGPADGSDPGEAVVTDLGSGKWTIEPLDATGPTIIQLSGFGPEGDVHVVFQAELGS